MTADVTIYHNPRCTKSRQTLTLLRENGVEPDVVEYLKTPLTKSGIQKLVRQLGIPATDLLRTKEKLFREVCPDSSPSNAEALQLMADHPRLMERPIVVTKKGAAIGRPPENVLEVI
ncbi:MAG: arsenate reductase (glutaredoxin) [Fuerstiella sp.]